MRARKGSLYTPTSPSLPAYANGNGFDKLHLTTATTVRPRWPPRWLRALRRRRSNPLLKGALLVALALALFLVWTYEPHVEIQLYSRRWIAAEVHHLEPLGGCFDPGRVSPQYNVTRHLHAPKHVSLHAGTPLRTARDCYAFASTIPAALPPSSPHAPAAGDGARPVYFHSYWRTDLAAFSARQEHFLKSFLATQHPAARLILWSNGDLAAASPLVRWYTTRFPGRVEARTVRAHELARGTALEGNRLLDVRDRLAYVDGDLVRLLVVWAYGGVWVDVDTLLTRDLSPLFEHEFVTQWDCYGTSHHHALCHSNELIVA
jgi:hypothetical protein